MLSQEQYNVTHPDLSNGSLNGALDFQLSVAVEQALGLRHTSFPMGNLFLAISPGGLRSVAQASCCSLLLTKVKKFVLIPRSSLVPNACIEI